MESVSWPCGQCFLRLSTGHKCSCFKFSKFVESFVVSRRVSLIQNFNHPRQFDIAQIAIHEPYEHIKKTSGKQLRSKLIKVGVTAGHQLACNQNVSVLWITSNRTLLPGDHLKLSMDWRKQSLLRPLLRRRSISGWRYRPSTRCWSRRWSKYSTTRAYCKSIPRSWTLSTNAG